MRTRCWQPLPQRAHLYRVAVIVTCHRAARKRGILWATGCISPADACARPSVALCKRCRPARNGRAPPHPVRVTNEPPTGSPRSAELPSRQVPVTPSKALHWPVGKEQPQHCAEPLDVCHILRSPFELRRVQQRRPVHILADGNARGLCCVEEARDEGHSQRALRGDMQQMLLERRWCQVVRERYVTSPAVTPTLLRHHRGAPRERRFE